MFLTGHRVILKSHPCFETRMTGACWRSLRCGRLGCQCPQGCDRAFSQARPACQGQRLGDRAPLCSGTAGPGTVWTWSSMKRRWSPQAKTCPLPEAARHLTFPRSPVPCLFSASGSVLGRRQTRPEWLKMLLVAWGCVQAWR